MSGDMCLVGHGVNVRGMCLVGHGVNVRDMCLVGHGVNVRGHVSSGAWCECQGTFVKWGTV